MATNSKIEWTDHTVNLWWGCSKVHTGCKNCYAEYLSDTRYKKNLWGPDGGRRMIKSAFKSLDRYEADAIKNDRMVNVFVGSMMDIWEESRPLENPDGNYDNTGDLRYELVKRIRNGKYNHINFLFLTKRPGMIPDKIGISSFECILDRPNVWLGTSVSDQATADKYLPLLKQWAPANLFISAEPLVGPIDTIDLEGIKWVICGGESGHKRRPIMLDWIYTLAWICEDDGVPFFLKQIDKVVDKEDEYMKLFLEWREMPASLYL